MTRTVTAETVISAIRRISRENYDIYIIGEAMNSTNIKNNFGEYYIDDFNIASETDKTYKYVSEVVKNDYNNNIPQYALYLTLTDIGYTYITNDNVQLIYDAIKSESFKEYIGIWQSGSDVSDANKTTYRIITYVQV